MPTTKHETDINISFYTDNALKVAREYDSVSFEDVHGHWWNKLVDDKFTEKRLRILDVGAGSGRDSAFLLNQGHDVVAIEPSKGMQAHLLAKLPDLNVIANPLPMEQNIQGKPFDLILLSAVWMHIRPEFRERAFNWLENHLSKGGRLIIFLRHGPFSDGRKEHPVSADEIKAYALSHGLVLTTSNESEVDLLGRGEVFWETVIISKH
jgi:SAM-dependent methyltransferase